MSAKPSPSRLALAEEQLVFERSRPGRRAGRMPALDVPAAPDDAIPDAIRRKNAPLLPEVSENELVRHYTRLSQRNWGIDTGFYPLGSCSMKYNPKLAEDAAAMAGFRRLHPLQPESQTQGALQMLVELERTLCAITGMAGVTFQPAAGAHGELTGLLIMRAFHEHNGQRRKRVIIPDSAHGTNPASVTLAGYETQEVPSDARGLVDIEALERMVGDDVAGFMITNPNTLGLFEENIERVAAAIHSVGGLLYYDGANLNAILGRSRPGDMGFDIVHMNLHKTFATPHGGGGPGAGPLAVSERLLPFLPGPRPAYDEASGRYRWDEGDERSIGRMHTFWGNFGILVRASSYARTLGSDGLRHVAEHAVLNANYLAHRSARNLRPGVPVPADARVRADGAQAEGARCEGDGHREARARLRLPRADRLLPADRRRGDDGRAHRDRGRRDARRVRRGVDRDRRRDRVERRDAQDGAAHRADQPPRRGTRRTQPCPALVPEGRRAGARSRSGGPGREAVDLAPLPVRIIIKRRFRGPPESGNGGYSCGMLGTLMPGPAEVTLRKPPPLDTPMEIEQRPDGTLAAVHDGADVIAARAADVDIAIPGAVSLATAERAAASYEGFKNHAFPMCFVCGPEREAGDGLRIFPGELPGGVAAAPWIPDRSVADEDGVVHPEIVWAALDCPSGWSPHYAYPEAGVGLLGRLAATLLRPVIAGERYIAASWPAGRDGRKMFAKSAILGEDGEPFAVAHATWIELKEQP